MAAALSKSEKALLFITNIKLREVEEERRRYQDMAKTVLDRKEAYAGDDKESLLRRVELLISAVKDWKGPGQLEGTTVGKKLDLKNLDLWMEQARKEAGFDLKVVKGWEETLTAHIHHTSARFDAAELLFQMYNEWIESDDIKVVSQPLHEAGEIEVEVVEEGFDMVLDAPGVDGSDLHQEQRISGAERKTTREKERVLSIISNDYPSETDKLMSYLDDLFGNEDANVALSRVRASLYAFGSSFRTAPINGHTISQAISNLLAMGPIDENQRDVLREILSSDAALQEVANVVQIRLVNLKTWKWPQKRDTTDAPRDASDNLSAFADPRLIDSILWEYIGNRWREEMKTALRKIFDSHAWKRNKPSTEQINAMCTIEPLTPNDSIDTKREKMRSRYFFLPNLNNSATSLAINYDFNEMHQREKDIRTRSLCMFRRILLHLMATESRLNNALHGSHTMVQVRLDDLEYSISHQSILIVLAYLGVPEDWISIFHSFLAMPISSEDSSTSCTCKRGTPPGYTLSVVMREAVLHMMDFAVNQRTGGLFLYRIGSEIWFWDASAEICSEGQKEMEYYASLVGVNLKTKRTDVSRPTASEILPMEDVKWGFLKFDPAQVGFVIDQREVDLQITEFRHRLAMTTSMIGWVEMYNRCMVHIWRNFGGVPAECLGSGFVDNVIDTITRIHRELFLQPDIGPGAYLRKIVGERFGVHGLPDGYFYLPFSSGGLDVCNVVLWLTSLEKGKGRSPGPDVFPRQAGRSSAPSQLSSNAEHSPASSRFTHQFYSDLNDYKDLVSRWKVEECGRSRKSMPVEQAFISFNEYVSLRECHLTSWGKVYDSMFQNLRAKRVSSSLAGVHPNPTRSAFAAARIRGTESYSQWVVSIYGEDVIKRFGTLNVVDKLLIPVAMTDGCRFWRLPVLHSVQN